MTNTGAEATGDFPGFNFTQITLTLQRVVMDTLPGENVLLKFPKNLRDSFDITANYDLTDNKWSIAPFYSYTMSYTLTSKDGIVFPAGYHSTFSLDTRTYGVLNPGLFNLDGTLDANKGYGFALDLDPPALSNGIQSTDDDKLNFYNGAAGNPILPVTGLKLSGNVANDGSANLKWSTITEINSAYFEVERSINGGNWQVINKVTAAGNSNVSNTYSAKDNNIHAGSPVAYRIRLYDKDGKLSTSNIIMLTLAKGKIAAYPNPTKGKVYVTGLNDGNEVTVRNLAGQMLRNTKVAGNALEVNLSAYPQGTYLLMVTDNGKITSTFKVVKD